ncbi:sensor histidine kinase [Microvirga massiliensis]|uniref:sensor histidine kinase n=1 Tax=Microvirga massiliensis TaxID=1033741 RepID=UPI0009E249C5|nr:PAS domain-containing sensor histidine kinase [Microvirga massiliensis]
MARARSNGSDPGRQSRRGCVSASSDPMFVANSVGTEAVATEALLRSTLDSLSAHVAVLDATGTIIAVNQAWRSFAIQSGYVGEDDGVGTNYLDVCERGAPFSSDAAATAKALREIIAGRRRDFRMEYPCTGPDGPRWFQLRITRPDQQEMPRIVIAHEDITEVKRVQEELAHLTARLMQLQDEERRSIARELHDTTAQNLLAVTLNVTRLRERLRTASPASDRILTETLALAEQSLQEVRTLSYLLHPPLLDVVGLGSALRWLGEGFSERSGIAVDTVVGEGVETLSRDAATALFRVAQECLANVHRHARSSWARIALHRLSDGIRLEVSDGGCGFNARSLNTGVEPVHQTGVGVSGMRVRLEQLRGSLQIDSGPAGTRVTATVPLTQ